MITPELLEFLRTQHAEGMSIEEMEHLLVTEGGWNKEDITDAFRQIGVLPPTPVVSVETPLVQAPPEPVDAVSVEPQKDIPEVSPALLYTSPAPIDEGAVKHTEVPDMLAHVLAPAAPTAVIETPVIEPEVVAEQIVPEVTEVSSLTPAPDSAPLEPIAPKILELSVVRETPVVGSSEHVEDFLGLFSEPQVSQEISPAIQEVLATVGDAPQPVVPETIPLAESGTASGIQDHIDSLAQNIPALEEKNSEVPVLSPDMTPLVFGKKPEWSFQDMLAQKKLSPQDDLTIVSSDGEAQQLSVPSEDAKGIQFDLSRVDAPVEKVLPSLDSADAVTRPKMVARPVETKSVAEIWLAGTNQTEKPITPYSSSTPRATLAHKRTMNSDLLRGKGDAVRSMPALSSENLPTPAEMPQTPVAIAPQPTVKSPAVTAAASPILAEDLKRKNNIKRVVTISIGGLLVLLVLGIVAMLFMSKSSIGITQRLSAGFSQFAGASTFTYSGDGFADFVLSTPASGDGVARSGIIKFVLKYSGALKNSAEGYGDGVHQVKLIGGLQTGNFAWNTDVESDVRVIGNTLYFHLLSYPAASDFDPDVMKSYWIKIDLAALMNELALSAGNSGGQGYGSFGSGKSEMTFNRLYADNLPFSVDGTLEDENVNGVSMTHLKLKADKEHMFTFALKLYKKYTGNELVLSAEQQLRLKDALAKIGGEVWLDKVTNKLQKVLVRGDFDDDMVAAHVKGNTQLVFTLADQGKEISVSEPTPFLTLEEFRARTDEYKKNKDLRANDSVKLSGLEKIVSALAAYQKDNGRYPTTLLDLRTSGKLPVSVVDEYAIKQYSFASYLAPENLTKTGRCTSKGKNCAFYHIGVNFEDLTNPALATDADLTSDISGRDTSGCGGELNLSCFDVVSSSPAADSAASQSASSTAR